MYWMNTHILFLIIHLHKDAHITSNYSGAIYFSLIALAQTEHICKEKVPSSWPEILLKIPSSFGPSADRVV